ncbi:MAG TPA: M48 family metallopeptidase [Longimicrobiaceae bacterium]
MPETLRPKRILTNIDSRSWEHPADRAALNALRRIPVFDEVLRKILEMFGEKATRLAFLASAVRVSTSQYPRMHRLYDEVCTTLDAPGEYPLYVTQNPLLNAAAYGMNKPFIIVHDSLVKTFDDDELRVVLGHELGHVMSGHTLYTTMIRILLALAQLGFPVVGLAARAILIALLEWSRKAELSCDRAGILAVQDPEPGLRVMLKFAGGTLEGASLAEFIRQSDEYRETGDLGDQIYKVLNLLGMTHPFPVLRVAEQRTWYESGAYERILAGEYIRRGEAPPPYKDDFEEASKSYRESAKETFGQAAEAARKVMDGFRTGFNQG